MAETSYVHLRRYGKKPSGAEVATIDVIGDGQVVYRGHRYDLRAGEKGPKVPGFAHHLDGRYLQWNDGMLEILHPGGRVVATHVIGGEPIRIVGPYLVHGDDRELPWLVLDASTGEIRGRVEDQRGDATHGPVTYSPAWFDPRNDRTLWLCEGTRLAELDVAQRRMARTIEAPPDQLFVRCAALPDGNVLAIVRSLEHNASLDRTADRLALFAPSGEPVRDVPGDVMFLHVLGDQFIVSDDRKKQFVIYDRTLEPVASVPMFEPGKDGYNQLVALPGGRDWVAVGGRGEWDHYGAADLAPTSEAPAAKPRKSPVKKAAKKS